MHIFFDSPQQFKIELDREDMNELNITFEQMDYNDEHTREVLQGLLHRIGAPAGFDAESGRIIIEVFPSADDGCVVRFTAVEAERAKPTVRMRRVSREPEVYRFENAADMLAAVSAMHDTVGQDNDIPCELYLLDGYYQAVVYIDRDEKRAPRILSEFGSRVGTGTAAAAFTAEHGQLISENVAADIGKYL